MIRTLYSGMSMTDLPRCLLLAITVALSLSLAACQAVLHEKGTILDPKVVSQIREGATTKAQVRAMLGTPTFVSSLRNDRWSYLQDRHYKNWQKTFARVINRVEIFFDGRGIVQEVRHNFNGALLDPRTEPGAKSRQGWVEKWFEGQYERPAIAGQAADIPPHGGEGEEAASAGKQGAWW